MADEHPRSRCMVTGHGEGCFGLWLVGWLFTIGYLHLPFFWQGVLALLIWPYHLGVAVAAR